MVAYPFYFINLHSMHETNRMQSIEQITMWEVFSSICPYLCIELMTKVLLSKRYIQLFRSFITLFPKLQILKLPLLTTRCYFHLRSKRKCFLPTCNLFPCEDFCHLLLTLNLKTFWTQIRTDKNVVLAPNPIRLTP